MIKNAITINDSKKQPSKILWSNKVVIKDAPKECFGKIILFSKTTIRYDHYNGCTKHKFENEKKCF